MVYASNALITYISQTYGDQLAIHKGSFQLSRYKTSKKSKKNDPGAWSVHKE